MHSDLYVLPMLFSTSVTETKFLKHHPCEPTLEDYPEVCGNQLSGYLTFTVPVPYEPFLVIHLRLQYNNVAFGDKDASQKTCTRG